MKQLVNLQFAGYRDIFEDINKAICGQDTTIKDVTVELEPYGGLMGRIYLLENKIQRLENQVNDVCREVGNIRYQMITKTEQEKMFEKKSLPTDIESILPVIRNEARNIAEAVFRTQIHNCYLNIN